MSGSEWFHRRGALARDGWETRVDATLPGWQHTGLRVGEAGTFTIEADDVERIVVPLDARSVVIETTSVRDGGGRIELNGRTSVFAGPTDVAYLGIGTGSTITSDGRFAVAEAPATEVAAPRGAARGGGAGRGAGGRGIHSPGAQLRHARGARGAEAHRVRGDHARRATGRRTRRTSTTPTCRATSRGSRRSTGSRPAAVDGASGEPFGTFAAYSSPGHEIEIDERVRTGDVALVPHGYHGPAAAAPGYDLYYLNVMAGPDPDRVWLITDDPAHTWVRSTWTESTQNAEDETP